MTQIRKRSLALFLLLTLLFSITIPASARASEYFHRTYVKATDIGSGVIRILVDVGATETMQELGATQVIVYEKQSDGSYDPVKTYTRSEYPSLISYNRASHASYITHYGTPGKSYYALCAFYAKNSSGSQIKWSSSNVT